MANSILVVDDKFEDVSRAKSLLEKSGYSVVPATNGAKAMDLLKGGGVDLLLLDIQLPTLSGYDLLSLLKGRQDGRMKIIYISIVPRKDVDMAGVDGFIQKPFSPSSLLGEVKRVLK